MAQTPASQPPARNTSGFSSDPPYGPLADCGNSNPFFYHQFQDDFDNQLGSAGLYTVSASGAGTVAHTAGDGGLVLFTTAAAANSFESIQLPAASFTLPGTGTAPPATQQSSKKLFYLVRLQLANITTNSFIAGLCNTTATPFTTGAQSITDGLFFYKAAGGTVLQVLNIGSAGNSPTGVGYTNTFNIPTAAYSAFFANNSFLDLAFEIDRQQNLKVWVGQQLVGWITQSGTGSVNSAGVSILPVNGPAFVNYQVVQGANAFSTFATPVLYTLANLNVTLALSNGATASATTMIADFHCVEKER
jgi:hypothetical protein